MWRLAAVYVLLWCVVLWWVLLGCVLLWCDVVLCYAVLYGRRNLTKNPSLKLSGKNRHPRLFLSAARTHPFFWGKSGKPTLDPQKVGVKLADERFYLGLLGFRV